MVFGKRRNKTIKQPIKQPVEEEECEDAPRKDPDILNGNENTHEDLLKIFGQVPEYKDFFECPEKFERIHMHLNGVRVKAGADKDSFVGQSFFGVKHSITPYVISKAVGKDTGSTDFFDIGTHEFVRVYNNKLPVWDRKVIHITKKGEECTEGLEINLYDGQPKKEDRDKPFLRWTIPRSDFPASGTDWTEITLDAPKDSKEKFDGLELVLKLRITGCEDSFLSVDDLMNFQKSTGTISYSEVVQEGEEEQLNSLVQCWRHKEKAKKALLWILGRNDCFMHVEVAKKLFLDRGYDIYVLNWSCNGHCRKKGWIKKAYHVSHNCKGDFNVYNDEIDKALSLMKSHSNYEQKLSYSHSTGAPVLINYLIERGDDPFDGFIFNSPFMDVPFLGTTAEFISEKVLPFLARRTPFMNVETEISGPPKLDKPLMYYNNDIMITNWHAKLWSQYNYDLSCRTTYYTPLTMGALTGTVRSQDKILKYVQDGKFVLTNIDKPILCLSSKNDDTVDSQESLTRIDSVGIDRTEIELSHNAHDVFLSVDEKDVNLAYKMALNWMQCKGFA